MPGAQIALHRPSVGEREAEAVRAVLDSRWLGMGRLAEEFEARICELVGCRHAVAVSSGSAALHLALAALGVGPGDEIVLPSLTHVSCPQAVLAVGAKPVFCDVDARTASVDPDDAAVRVTPRTRALLPVHYAGFPCAPDQLTSLAQQHGIAVVEDAAHAFGSFHRGRAIGTIGDTTCFSFDPVKNVTCGEGGAVTTDDDEIARRIRQARNLGVGRDSWMRHGDAQPWHYEAAGAGFRYHLPDVNAAIGLAQLERFDALRSRKQELLRLYLDGLAAVPGIEVIAGDVGSAFPFLFATRVLDGRRDALLAELLKNGIQGWVHFVPTHLHPAFAARGAELPVTEELYGQLLTLPLHAELRDDEVLRVVTSVRRFLGEE